MDRLFSLKTETIGLGFMEVLLTSKSMNGEEKEFKERLEGAHTFPGPYIFKFIVKPEQKPLVEALVENASISTKPSSGNKYVSVTIKAEMQTSEEVIEVYKEAKKIEGIISL